MSRVEELPDSFDASMNLTSLPPQTSTQAVPETAAEITTPFPLPPKPQDGHAPLPELPPQMDSVRSHSTSEVLSMMNRTPLFVTSLDDAGDGTPVSSSLDLSYTTLSYV